MTISNQQTCKPARILVSVLATIHLATVVAVADTVELHNGDTLSGTIQSLEKGLVTLRSALTPAPLEIKASSVGKITFSERSDDTPTHTELLTLSNHDVIPCKVISMDDKQLHITTWYAGEFKVPRSNILSLQFGISKEQVIFDTSNTTPWTTREGNWTIKGNTYSCAGNGTLAREFNLPENIRINFDLAWKDTPNFAFRFCAEKDTVNTKQDTYELIFNSAGMQIRRYENENQPAASIANINAIKPLTVEDRKINIDLRVNRGDGLLSLYVDQKLIGTWPDPFATSKGNFIIFNNRTSRQNGCIISNLAISGLHDGMLPRHREKTSIATTDILIDSEGEKISGSIGSISQAAPNQRTIIFNAKHGTAPLSIPDRRVSILAFAQTESGRDFPETTFKATIEGGGFLQLENPKLVDGILTSIHPVLGPCKLSTKALAHISQSQEKKESGDR